jgi:hypothetical protein
VEQFNDQNIFRIGAGAAFSSDRLDPAVDLVKRGQLHAIVFECLAERTLAFGHRDRKIDPTRGYNPLLERRMRAVLADAAKSKTRIITNMGAANARAAAEKTIEVARELGLHGTKVAAVEGDDVTHLITPDTLLWEGVTVAGTGLQLIAANAYLGIDALLPALKSNAEVIITGRVADPSLFLAPMMHHFGWSNWNDLGAGTVVGHLLECASQVTGGYFMDPGYKDVPNLAYLGFPIAVVAADGSAVITKLSNTGGLVDARTVKEQLMYEIHDPRRYMTPDVTADFSQIEVEPVGENRVRVAGASGTLRPDTLKATVAFDGGFLAEAGISYAGSGAQNRAQVSGQVIAERMRHVHNVHTPIRVDVIGQSSLHSTATNYPTDTRDVRMHCALRTPSREEAELLLWEVEALMCCGPAGGGGYRGNITPSVITYSASITRSNVNPQVEILVA